MVPSGWRVDGIPSFRYPLCMAKRKATIYIEDDILRAAKVWAARTGRRDYEVVEDALRAYLGFGLLEKVRSRSNLSEDEATRLAYKELHAARAE